MKSSSANRLADDCAAEVRSGAILNDKYVVDGEIGAGGMGVVYAAHHLQLQARLAVKVLLSTLLDNAEAIGRFEREARTAAMITHENVIRVFDVGELRCGAPYMVMEFLQGQDLGAYLDEHGPLSMEEAIGLCLQVCSGLSAAHRLGVVHRDLKPANLFCVFRADDAVTLKVLDFGISKIDAHPLADHDTSTQTGFALGSPTYASPEQWRDAKRADSRTDIWSLGVVLYELLSGTVPFSGASVADLGIKIATQPPTPLREVLEGAPPELERIVLRCLEKAPEARFDTVDQLAQALQTWLRDHRLGRGSKHIGDRIRASRRAQLVAGTAVLVLTAGVASSLLKRSTQPSGAFRETHERVEAPATERAIATAGSSTSSSSSSAVSTSAGEPQTSMTQDRPAAVGPGMGPVASAVGAAGASTPAPVQRRVDAGLAARPRACDPPFYFDARGNRVFKVECL